MEEQNFFCRNCHQVGPMHTVCGIANCAYCGSMNVQLTHEPLPKRPRWKGGPGNRFFVRTRRAKHAE